MLAMLSFAAPVPAATTTVPIALSPGAYTDLGAGPMWLGASGGGVVFQVADSQPSPASFGDVVQTGAQPVNLQTTAHVWARSVNAIGVSAIVTSGTGVTSFGGGTVNASIGGFSPNGANPAALTAADALTHNVALPTTGAPTDFKVENLDSNVVYCLPSTSGASTATASAEPIAAGGKVFLHGVFGATTWTNLACISPSASLNVKIVGGAGLGVDTAGASAGGGGGGAVTLNATPSISNGNGVVPTQGGAVLSATNGAYSNLLQNNTALSTSNPLFTQLTAGSAIAGKFGIDQTTLGTTNGVSLADIGAAAVSTGAGATGTGTQRVGVAQDNSTIAGSAPGAAGVASSQVISAQGIAGMTPFLANPGTAANWGVNTIGSTTSGQSGQLGFGAVTTTPPSYTTGQSDPLSLDVAGNLRINCVAGCSSSSGITGWAGGTIGTATLQAFGATEATIGAGLVPAINAHITNTLASLTPGDAIPTSTFASASPTLGGTLLWNGTSYDRWKEAGVAGAGMVGGAAAAGTAVGSAGNPILAAFNIGGVSQAPRICGSHAFAHVTASGNTQIVALSSGKTVYICDYSLSDGSTATNAYLESATAASCGGTLAQIDMLWSMAANGGAKGAKAFYTGLNAGASNALCVNNSSANAFDIGVDYDQS